MFFIQIIKLPVKKCFITCNIPTTFNNISSFNVHKHAATHEVTVINVYKQLKRYIQINKGTCFTHNIYKITLFTKWIICSSNRRRRISLSEKCFGDNCKLPYLFSVKKKRTVRLFFRCSYGHLIEDVRSLGGARLFFNFLFIIMCVYYFMKHDVTNFNDIPISKILCY